MAIVVCLFELAIHTLSFRSTPTRYRQSRPGYDPTVATRSSTGEGEHLWFVGTLATIKVPGGAVEGRFSLTEFLFPHHASPPLHTHPQDESFFVLDGRLTVRAGDQRFELEPGGTAVFPMSRIFSAHGQVDVGPRFGPED